MRELREAVWEQVPLGAEPEQFRARRTLLLREFAALGTARPVVLDAGCGAGEFSRALLAVGAQVIAADAAQGALDRVAVSAPAARRILWPDGEPLAVESGSVALVWAGETLEHVGDGEAWLAELERVLQPGGRLLLTVPAHPFLTRLHLALSSRAFDAHFAPWQDHLRFFTPRTLATILDRAGFTDIHVRSAFGLPFARRTLVSRARKRD